MSALYNRAKMTVSGTPGTGVVTLGAAISALFFTLAEAGVPNGASNLPIVFEDGTNVQLARCTYSSTGPTLTVDSVVASKIAGVAGTTQLSLTSAAILYIDPMAADIAGDVRPLVFKDINNPSVNYTIYSDLIASDERLIIKSSGWPHRLWLDTDDDTSVAFSMAIDGVEQFSFGAGFSTDLVTFLLTAPATNFGIINSTFNTFFLLDQANVRLGIGTDAPQRTLHALQESATTNGVIPVGRFSATSSGTPANGIGASLEFDVETGVSNYEIGATIEAVATDVTASSEDFDFVIKTMAGGAAAAERFRINSTIASFTGNINAGGYINGVSYGLNDISLVTDSGGYREWFAADGGQRIVFAPASEGLFTAYRATNHIFYADDGTTEFGRINSSGLEVAAGKFVNIDGDTGAGGYYLNSVLLVSQGSGYRGFKDSTAVERLLLYPPGDGALNDYFATVHVFRDYSASVTFAGIDSSGLGVFGRIFAELDSAATNTVSYPGLLTSTSSGTPAAGIGVGLQLEVETAAGNKEIGATVEAVTTDVTAASEDFDLVFKTMAAGAPAAEALRISSSWEYLGVPKTLSKNFIVRTDYEHIVQKRLTMTGSLRATLQGTANLILTDDMGSRSRIVLAGRG